MVDRPYKMSLACGALAVSIVFFIKIREGYGSEDTNGRMTWSISAYDMEIAGGPSLPNIISVATSSTAAARVVSSVAVTSDGHRGAESAPNVVGRANAPSTPNAPMSWLRDVEIAHVPGLLSAMGVINTLAVFVYSTVLNRVAAMKHRRRTTLVFLVAWLSMVSLVVAYVLHSVFDWKTGLLVDLGLSTWAMSFLFVLSLIRSGARDSVRISGSPEKRWNFHNRFDDDTFGIQAIDLPIKRARQAKQHIHYPFLLMHDIETASAAGNFVRAGLDRGEAVIYLTFSRPHTIIADQVTENTQRSGAAGNAAPIWIVDAYSPVYMPETRTNGGARVLFADSRDPIEVYAAYARALTAISSHRNVDGTPTFKSVRTVYETLSDFIKIADGDLVLHYLRRVVVLEEVYNIRALYLFWDGAVRGNIDQQYLQWFFNTTILMTRKREPKRTTTCVVIDRMFSDRVTIQADSQFQYDEMTLFQLSPERTELLARAVQDLAYSPKPYGFLHSLSERSRRKDTINFIFFMVAVDHDTHRGSVRYESELDGNLTHGSDLLYKLAERAKVADPTLFLPASFRDIEEEVVQRIFVAPNGRIPSDISGRTEIFRGSAAILLDEYEGDAVQLLARSNARIAGDGGLFERLSHFPAYADPVGKKSNLLAKILMREKLFDPSDKNAVRAAIDHVVMTMVLRSGLVTSVDEETIQTIVEGTPLDGYKTEVLRSITSEGLNALSKASNVEQDKLDDLFWSYGRKSLRVTTPMTDPAAVASELDSSLRVEALPTFIRLLNGLDMDTFNRNVRQIAGPFTRYY